jgi:hypothetical protein
VNWEPHRARRTFWISALPASKALVKAAAPNKPVVDPEKVAGKGHWAGVRRAGSQGGVYCVTAVAPS